MVSKKAKGKKNRLQNKAFIKTYATYTTVQNCNILCTGNKIECEYRMVNISNKSKSALGQFVNLLVSNLILGQVAASAFS